MIHRPADVAVLLVCFGLLLLTVECLRPGRVIPGAAGLLSLLLGVHTLASLPLRPTALALVVAAILLLAGSAVSRLGRVAGVLGTATLASALPQLVNSPARITPSLGIAAGLVLGAAAFMLLRIAARARANKRGAALSRPARVD